MRVQCGEREFFRVIKSAFELEVELGTWPHRALFVVASGAMPGWTATYHGEAFGSWMIESPGPTSRRVVYDGKESRLSIDERAKPPIWEGPLKKSDDVPDTVFEYLMPPTG